MDEERTTIGPRPARHGRLTALSNVDPALRHCWHPVAAACDIGHQPIRVRLLGESLVLARGESGQVIALADRCPHRLAPLSAGTVVGDTIMCAYHGWRFDAAGRCQEIPALGPGARLPPKAHCGAPAAVAERYGLVFVALDDPIVAIPDVEGYADADRVRVDIGPYSGRYGAAQLIDNQLDIAHFAFLHRGTFGSPDAAQPDPYEVRRSGFGFECSMTIPITAVNDPGALLGERPLAQERTMRYRYAAPFCVELRLDYPATGGSNVIVFFAQPEDAEHARLFVSLLFHEPAGLSEDLLAERVAFEERVVGEDLALQERFESLELPLDLTAECHLRIDRSSVEFRRILADLRAAVRSAGEVPLKVPPAMTLLERVGP